ncbi:MAG: energy-coupling factor transporter ATPase [Clostridia bacterium]|nr:energy-coupling factor transporter ATPase [Clostridia bacterium]
MPSFTEPVPLIEARDLCYTYPDDDPSDDVPAVKNVSLKVYAGEHVALLGHNGSGKSTLAKLLSQILVPQSGDLLIDGKSCRDLGENELFDLRKNIGMVFQNPDNQLVATVVEEDIAFGPENLGIPSEEIRRRVDEALDAVGMREYARTSPHMLSGGQKQRIAVAGILAMMPRCIVFDEATAMLDPSGRDEVMETACRLNRERGITIINITHHMAEAVRADRVYVMHEGSMILSGTPREVFGHIATLRDVALEAPAETELLYSLNRLGGAFPLPVLDADLCADLIAQKYRETRKNG